MWVLPNETNTLWNQEQVFRLIKYWRACILFGLIIETVLWDFEMPGKWFWVAGRLLNNRKTLKGFHHLGSMQFLQRHNGIQDRSIRDFFIEYERESKHFGSIFSCDYERVKVGVFGYISRFFRNASKPDSFRHAQLESTFKRLIKALGDWVVSYCGNCRTIETERRNFLWIMGQHLRSEGAFKGTFCNILLIYTNNIRV